MLIPPLSLYAEFHHEKQKAPRRGVCPLKSTVDPGLPLSFLHKASFLQFCGYCLKATRETGTIGV